MGRLLQCLGIAIAVFWTFASWADTAATLRVFRSPAEADALPSLPNETQVLSATEMRPLPVSRPSLIPDRQNLSAFGLPCGLTLKSELRGKSVHSIRLVDPCRARQSVAFRYAGLRFDALFSSTGNLQLDIPALSENGGLEMTFEDGLTEDVALEGAELDHLARIALAWTGPDAPTLVMQSDHVQTMLGSQGQSIQIVTHQIEPNRAEIIRLQLDRTISEAACQSPGKGRIIRKIGARPQVTYGLSFAPPDCHKVGQTIELKNVLEDLKLAAD